jgi:hypothetical protein
MREETYIRYYADDGSVFYNKADCEEYENNCTVALERSLPDLYISELEHIEPLSFSFKTHGMLVFRDNYIKYQWFICRSIEEYERIVSALPVHSRLRTKLHPPTTYPDILAVELITPCRKNSTEHWRYSGCYTYYSEEKRTTTQYLTGVNEVLQMYTT